MASDRVPAGQGPSQFSVAGECAVFGTSATHVSRHRRQDLAPDARACPRRAWAQHHKLARPPAIFSRSLTRGHQHAREGQAVSRSGPASLTPTTAPTAPPLRVWPHTEPSRHAPCSGDSGLRSRTSADLPPPNSFALYMATSARRRRSESSMGGDMAIPMLPLTRTGSCIRRTVAERILDPRGHDHGSLICGVLTDDRELVTLRGGPPCRRHDWRRHS
jgi:hypothetical protein